MGTLSQPYGRKNKLEQQEYYHGLRERDDVHKYFPEKFDKFQNSSDKNLIFCLTKHEGNFCSAELDHVGDFAVRVAMDSAIIFIVISVKVSKRNSPIDIRLLSAGGKYMLPGNEVVRSHSVVDLINYYSVQNIPGYYVPLKYGVPRPAYMLSHESLYYKEKDKLGAGNFCTVYKGEVTMPEGHKLSAAIKVCHPDTAHSREAIKSLLHEAKIMADYDHPNVVDFYGINCDHPPIRIMLEFCSGGSLDTFIQKYHQDIKHAELMMYATDAALGMCYLHLQKCLHRDLAARNCLISDQGLIKIADFGLSKLAAGTDNEVELKHIPLRWMAPETLRRPPQYLMNSDVWSYGCLVYELFNKGVRPFDNVTDVKTVARRIRHLDMPPFPEGTPEVVAKYVREDIWLLEPSERRTFADISQYFYKYLSEKEEDGIHENINQLAVNRFLKVKRTQILHLNKDEVLNPDRLNKNKAQTRKAKENENRQKMRKRRAYLAMLRKKRGLSEVRKRNTYSTERESNTLTSPMRRRHRSGSTLNTTQRSVSIQSRRTKRETRNTLSKNRCTTLSKETTHMSKESIGRNREQLSKGEKVVTAEDQSMKTLKHKHCRDGTISRSREDYEE